VSREDLTSLVAIAHEAALAGGRVVAASHAGLTVEVKGSAGDYVTEVDRASEDAIAKALADRVPGIPVVGEEGGGQRGRRYWVVDPLDGTTNFLHGFHDVGVSVALMDDGRPVVGVVHGPFLGETYVGARGLGAEARPAGGPTRPLRVSERPVEQAVVATGFPFRRKDRLPRYMPMLEACVRRFEDLRRPGAAALDLAWVAAGVFEGFFELGLGTWDVAAGGLLIQEAGGHVSDWSGGPDYLSGHVLAGSPAVHAALVELAAGTEPGDRL
jgi:myo-inositol-1(or 4)-monophosphatase